MHLTPLSATSPQVDTSLKEPRATVLIPGARVRYLAEIAEQGRGINAQVGKQAEAADRAQSFWQALRELDDPKLPSRSTSTTRTACQKGAAQERMQRASQGAR